jgi:pyruvate formate-lyase activating enzyme-like uncharacterized protein
MTDKWTPIKTETGISVRMAPQLADALREIKGEMSHMHALTELMQSSREDAKKLWRAVLEELDKHGK